MEKLLQWGIAHSVKNDEDAAEMRLVAEEAKSQAGPGQKLDPAVLDAILGKSDAQLMKEAMDVIVNEANSLDDRLTALDNLEMLVEQVDNANNLQNLGMWPALFALLSAPEDEIRQQAAWVTGTAVQNNSKAQDDFMALDPLSTLLGLLANSSNQQSNETRSKAMYNISGLLKHNPQAVNKFAELGGWQALKSALSDSDKTVRRKAAFLLNTLLLQDAPAPSGLSSATGLAPHAGTHFPNDAPPRPSTTDGSAAAAFEEHRITDELLRLLPPAGTPDDADFAEKATRALITLAQETARRKPEQKGRLPDEKKRKLRKMFGELERREAVEPGSLERLGIAKSELEDLHDALA